MALGLSIVHKFFIESPSASKVKELADYYQPDLPSRCTFAAEIHLWKCKWERVDKADLPSNPADALKHADCDMFPNIHCLLRLICNLPVTSCGCERSISVLRIRLKSYMRSTVGLSSLALLHIHCKMDLNSDEIIKIFARKHPRRMSLVNILCK